MSLLQRTGVYQKTDHWLPALTPGGVMTGDVSEVTETVEDVRIFNVPDDVQERACGHAVAARNCFGLADPHENCRLRKVVWRPAHKVHGAEGRSHIVCSCCYLRGACARACERDVPERIFTDRSLTDDSEVVRSIITARASSRSVSNALKPPRLRGRQRACRAETTVRLTLHTDFALRVLIHVRRNGGKLTTIKDASMICSLSAVSRSETRSGTEGGCKNVRQRLS